MTTHLTLIRPDDKTSRSQPEPLVGNVVILLVDSEKQQQQRSPHSEDPSGATSTMWRGVAIG